MVVSARDMIRTAKLVCVHNHHALEHLLETLASDILIDLMLYRFRHRDNDEPDRNDKAIKVAIREDKQRMLGEKRKLDKQQAVANILMTSFTWHMVRQPALSNQTCYCTLCESQMQKHPC